MNLTNYLLWFAVIIASASVAQAQHSIDVQRLAAAGDHFEALTTFDELPRRRRTTAARIAAARSAWALGLADRALNEYGRALQDHAISDRQQAQILLSRGIIEFQEGRYQVAILQAEKVIELLPEGSTLRANAWLLWGESLVRLSSYGAAEQKYLEALQEASTALLPDIHYLLGECRIRLGKLEDARENFEHVPLEHARTAEAIRRLAELALKGEEYEHAAFWLEKGRSEHPDSFLDSWVDYALVRVAIAQNDRKRVRELRSAASKKYPPSDYWFTLLDAAAEQHEWRKKGVS